MANFLNSKHFPVTSSTETKSLEASLNDILENDYHGSFFILLGKYQRILADNNQKQYWLEINKKLDTLFKCGASEVINGPMIGIPISIRDSDQFKAAAELMGEDRSVFANIELLATSWNATYADTGIWMGKAFEPVTRETLTAKTNNDATIMRHFNESTTRIGRNYFRQPPDPNALQAIGLPALSKLWKLKERPMSPESDGFDCELLAKNLEKEKAIPYSQTGGYFLCNFDTSIVPGMNGKDVYQLNYRWPALRPIYPMTRLVDELVRIDDGIYLGQLVYATRHYSFGDFTLPNKNIVSIGDTYPYLSLFDRIKKNLGFTVSTDHNYYGYQNNGYFLMVDPDYAKEFYADDAFPQLRPRLGEIGFHELGYDSITTTKPLTTDKTTTDAVPA